MKTSWLLVYHIIFINLTMSESELIIFIIWPYCKSMLGRFTLLFLNSVSHTIYILFLRYRAWFLNSLLLKLLDLILLYIKYVCIYNFLQLVELILALYGISCFNKFCHSFKKQILLNCLAWFHVLAYVLNDLILVINNKLFQSIGLIIIPEHDRRLYFLRNQHPNIAVHFIRIFKKIFVDKGLNGHL